MNGKLVGFCITLALVMGAHAAGLISAQSFPKTAADVPFTTRMALRAAGYAPFESEYDASGRCISGCAYSGITVDDERAAVERMTAVARADMARDDAKAATKKNAAIGSVPTAQVEDTNVAPVSDTTQPSGPVNAPLENVGTENIPSSPVSVTTPVKDSTPESVANVRTCSPAVATTPVGNRLPTGCPLAANPMVVTSQFSTARWHPVLQRYKAHRGVDLSAPVGTDVFATADGVVSVVNTNPSADPCGIYVKIIHDNNYATTYCHLSQVLVSQGDQVSAGCRIALSGNTGRATGPHLHYAITPNAAQGNQVAIDPLTMIKYCRVVNK